MTIPHYPRIRRLRREAFSRVMEAALLDDNMGAGVQISGTSGSGKSNLAEWLAERMLWRGIPYLYLDPHGTSARMLLRMTVSLPPRLRRKVRYIRFADSYRTVGINPLAVPCVNQSTYVYQSQLKVRVELTAQVIFSLFGEGTIGFANRTLLRKWLTRWLTTLAQSGLTFADVLLLVDPKQPVYQELLRLVPDELARRQMESLAMLKPSDLEAEIGSARNRILAVLDHPVCQTIFSRREHVLDFRAIYDEDVSLILDFDKADVLTDDAQQLIANLVLNQFLATVLSTPEAQRRRRLCFVDELGVFASSAPLLTAMCTEIRKYRTKFVLLHQGSARFPDRHENEFLNTITDMCRVHIFFRHSAADARFFGEQVSLATWGKPRIKHVQSVPQQFTVGHDLVELIDTSEGVSDGATSGTSDARATGREDGTSDQLTDTLGEAVDHADQRTRSSSQARGRSQQSSTSSTDTRTTSDSRTSTTSHSRTIKQQLISRIITRNIVTSIQFFTPEEIDRDHAARIVQFATGEAYLLLGGIGAFLVQAPLATDPLSRTPKFAGRKLAEFLSAQWRRPEFVSPDQVQQERQKFLEKLLEELRSAGMRRLPVNAALPQSLLPSYISPLSIQESLDDAPWKI